MSLFSLVDIKHIPTIGEEIPRESHMNANISEMLTIGLWFFFFFLVSVLFCFGTRGQVGMVVALVRLAYHVEQRTPMCCVVNGGETHSKRLMGWQLLGTTQMFCLMTEERRTLGNPE